MLVSEDREKSEILKSSGIATHQLMPDPLLSRGSAKCPMPTPVRGPNAEGKVRSADGSSASLFKVIANLLVFDDHLAVFQQAGKK